MERIKQAIEKVKNQQPNEAGQFVQAQPDSRGTTFASVIQQPSDVLEEVRYNQTRVVKLRAEHLERNRIFAFNKNDPCLLYTSDAADDLLCVDLGGRRIIKK